MQGVLHHRQDGGPAWTSTTGSPADNNKADKLIVFMQTARGAGGADPENYRLWGNLNLTITMWMWRRRMLSRERGVKRAVVLTPESFRKCLMSVSADASYLDWLERTSVLGVHASPPITTARQHFASMPDLFKRRSAVGSISPMWRNSDTRGRVTKMLSPRPAAISSAVNDRGWRAVKNARARTRTVLAWPVIASAASSLVPLNSFEPGSRGYITGPPR